MNVEAPNYSFMRDLKGTGLVAYKYDPTDNTYFRHLLFNRKKVICKVCLESWIRVQEWL